MFYDNRLVAAEETIAQLRDENSRIRADGGAPRGGGKGSGDDAALRDANWRLQQLQTQYDFLVSKTSAQGQSSKALETQMEEYANKVRDLRRALEELRHEKEASDIKAERVDELDQLNSELRRSNRSLEDKISRLCEAPFISDAFGQHESRLRFEDAAKEREEYMAKVHHLQEAVRTHFSALTSLKQHAAQLREEKEAAEKRCEDMKLRLGDLEGSSSLATEKLKLYSGDDGVDIEQLERALTLVKRRTEATGKLPFLEDPDGEESLTVPTLKRKLEEVQVMNLKLTEEVERFESMLKLQSGINKDLHKELETVVLKRDNERRVQTKRLEEAEEVSRKRSEKVQALEAQVRQLVYDVSQGGGKGPRRQSVLAIKKNAAEEEKADPSAVDPSQALLKELLDEGGGELNPDQNLMEVWVKNATIAPESLPSGSSTFAVVDFFDYESQTTQLLTGNKPTWDYAASYKVFVDDFFLRYLATDVVTIELNAASQGDFTMLARATIPLSALLKSKPYVQLNNLPMLSVRTGEIIAHLNAEIRLALPVSELFRLFLERHPSEKRLIQDKSNQRLIDATSTVDKAQRAPADISAAKADESRLYNDLEIAILKADGLPVAPGTKGPTTYVHFQFLGHPDKFTNPVPESAAPVFNERFSFATITNEQQVRLIRRSKLSLAVIDMNGEEAGADNEGLIGEVHIPLAELAEGQGFQDDFAIKDYEGRSFGTVTVGMRWKYAFHEERDLGPRGLSAIEVESLISAFSARDISEGVIDYRSFVRFVDPDPDTHRMISRLRNHADRVAEQEGRVPKDVFMVLFRDSATVDSAEFVSKIEMARIDALPEDLVKLFAYIDSDEDGHITLEQLLEVLNLDDNSAVSISLHDKLRERVADLQVRGIYVDNMFSEVDQWGAQGLVTRLDFKDVLKKMGFFLADEVEMADPATTRFVQLGANDPDAGIPENVKAAAAAGGLDDIEDELLFEDKVDKMTSAGASAEEINKAREEFEERSKEVMNRRQEALKMAAGADFKQEGYPKAKTPVKITGDGAPVDMHMHHSAVTATHGKPADASAPVGARPADAAPRAGKPPSHSVEVAPSLGRSPAILRVEKTVRTSLKQLEGLQPEPNFQGGFHTVDPTRSGIVSRTQFAHVMNQFQPQVSLHAADLRVVMDYFDGSTDGTKIDYEAFCRFVKCREPELMPALSRVKKMVLGPDSIRAMKAYDAMGNGAIKRSDMMRAMSELGYDHLGSATMLSILELFETKMEGQVNYGNFVEFVRENELSQQMDAASAKLFEMVTDRQLSPGAAVNLDDFLVRSWFDKIDVEGRGKVNSAQLDMFLDKKGISVTKEVAQSLVGQMCQQGRTEVNAHDFTAWAKGLPSAQSSANSMYSTPGLGEIRRKAQAYMFAVAKAGSPSLDELSQCFSIYDWGRPQTGTLDKEIFYHSCARAGFVFTMGELRTLVSEFGKEGTSVQYRRFLEWATPDSDVSSSSAEGPSSQAQARGNSVSSLIKFLEKKLLADVDLLSVFGRYDKKGVGHVTIDEFCAAFADLGISSLTAREAIELADRFQALINNFVMYRTVVRELLRQVDEATGATSVDPVDVVRAALQRSKVELRRLRDVFEYYDRKASGRVREDDLGTIFEEAQVKMRRSEIEAVSDKYCISGGASGSSLISYGALLTAVEGAMAQFGGVKSVGGLGEDASLRMREMFDSLIIRGIDFRAEFDRFDGDDYTGAVTQSSFRDLMQDKFRCSLSPRDLESVEKTYRDANDPRKVNFVRMIYELHPRFFSGVGASYKETSWEVAESLRSKIRRRCNYVAAGELKRPFRHFARRKGEDRVTLDDFAIGIRDLGIRAAADQVHEIFNSINTSGTSSFDYGDFVVFVKDPLNADVMWKVRRLLSRNRVADEEIINSLKDADRNDSGLLSIGQVEKSFRYCSVDLSDSDAARLMLRFDQEESSRFDNEKFFKFLRGQSTTGDAGMGIRGADDVETKAWSYLRQRVIDKLETGYSANEVFSYFDRDRRDTMDLAGLQDGAEQLGANLSRPEARGVMRRMTLLAGGPVDRKAFFESLEIDLDKDYRADKRTRDNRDDRDRDYRDRRDDDRDRRDDNRDRRDDDRGSASVADSRRELEETYNFIRSRVDGHKAVRDGQLPEEVLSRALSRAAGGNETISQAELSSGLEMLDVKATQRDLVRVFKQLDPSFTDRIAARELVNALYPGAASSSSRPGSGRTSARGPDTQALFKRRPDILSLVMEQVSSDRDLNELMSEFEGADRSRSGELERGEFGKCLARFGFKLSRAEERDLTDSIGEGRSGIDYRDFIAALESEVAKDQQSDDILIRLQKRLSRDEKNGQELMEAFDRMDRSGDGEIDVDELEAGMRRIGIPLDRDESRRIVQKFSVRGNSIKYKDFVRAMSGKSAGAADAVPQILDRLQRIVERRAGSAASAAREMRETFADFDKNGNGSISKLEFMDAMSALKVDVTRDETAAIFAKYDVNGDGDIDYGEFLRVLGATSQPSRDERDAPTSGRVDRSSVEKIADRLRRSIEDLLGSGSRTARRIKETFEDIDRNGNGLVDKGEFKEALKILRVEMDRDDVDDIFDYYDTDHNGLDYSEFIRLLGF